MSFIQKFRAKSQMRFLSARMASRSSAEYPRKRATFKNSGFDGFLNRKVLPTLLNCLIMLRFQRFSLCGLEKKQGGLTLRCFGNVIDITRARRVAGAVLAPGQAAAWDKNKTTEEGSKKWQKEF
ncbi:hypothetical protein [Pararhizobium gei]|uniref:hypothetical protein n=1 Tax=Pararhizobium gei TaxID=1395951 RepID=UPI0023DC1C38|nr:hypothetical protein [Rhizobium gei]